MGIKYFIFAVNKMDLAKYSEERFREIEKQIEALKAELGLENVYIVPVSATEGDNVTKASDNMNWYEGKPILSILEQVDIDENQEEGFYLPVQRVCRPNHQFRGFQGQIESGSIKVGDEITACNDSDPLSYKCISSRSRYCHTFQFQIYQWKRKCNQWNYCGRWKVSMG